jgi:hypothetical protein
MWYSICFLPASCSFLLLSSAQTLKTLLESYLTLPTVEVPDVQQNNPQKVEEIQVDGTEAVGALRGKEKSRPRSIRTNTTQRIVPEGDSVSKGESGSLS